MCQPSFHIFVHYMSSEVKYVTFPPSIVVGTSKSIISSRWWLNQWIWEAQSPTVVSTPTTCLVWQRTERYAMTPKPDCTLDNASRSPVDVLLLLFHIHPRSHVLRQFPYCKSPSCCLFLVGPSWYCSPRTVPEHSNSFVVRPSGSIHQQHEVLWQLHPRSGPKSTLSGHYDHGFSYLFVCLWNSSQNH